MYYQHLRFSTDTQKRNEKNNGKASPTNTLASVWISYRYANSTISTLSETFRLATYVIQCSYGLPKPKLRAWSVAAGSGKFLVVAGSLSEVGCVLGCAGVLFCFVIGLLWSPLFLSRSL